MARTADHTDAERVLEFLRTFQDEHGRSPSHMEIASGTGVRSPAYRLDQLAAAGRIRRVRGAHRSIQIVSQELAEVSDVPRCAVCGFYCVYCKEEVET